MAKFFVAAVKIPFMCPSFFVECTFFFFLFVRRLFFSFEINFDFVSCHTVSMSVFFFFAVVFLELSFWSGLCSSGR